jgi:hypothetical protein
MLASTKPVLISLPTACARHVYVQAYILQFTFLRTGVTRVTRAEQARIACSFAGKIAQAGTPTAGYQMPSKAIVDLLEAPVPPSYSFSPDRTKVCSLLSMSRRAPQLGMDTCRPWKAAGSMFLFECSYVMDVARNRYKHL